MDAETLYEIVYDATQKALEDLEGGDLRLLRRFVGGRVIFEDHTGREVKEIPVEALFKKVTAVREKLRVLEQKLNNHGGLTQADKAELQTYVTRAYGSLTTFNFLFAREADKFKGQSC